MYSIDQLFAMEDSQLTELAESMGMKKASTAPKEEVVYYILDNSASQLAKEAASKEEDRKKTRAKRGERKERTPRKKKGADEAESALPAAGTTLPAAEPISTLNSQLSTLEEAPAPKKRGRKPKAKAEAPVIPDLVEAAPAAETPSAAPAPSEDNISNSSFLTSNSQEEPPKKRRGRPRKADKEREAAEAAARAAAEVATPIAEIPAAVDTPASEPVAVENLSPENPGAHSTPHTPHSAQEGRKVFTPRNAKGDQKPSLDAFFGSMKGRTFKPRGAQPDQKEPQRPSDRNQDNSQPAENNSSLLTPHSSFNEPQAPIAIQEPGANSQAPLPPFPKHLNKRQRQQLQRQQQMEQKRMMQQMPEFEFEGILDTFGVLEVVPEGYGFLRSSDYNYLASPDDVYVTQQQIKEYGLKTGDVVEASIRPPHTNEKYYPLCKVKSVNGMDPAKIRDRQPFEHLVPLFPDEKFELAKGRRSNISTRVVDMFAPIGKGQRALIVAPPKTGKTILLKDIANVISENHPDTYIIMLLIDERPEEVTDMARSVNAEVIASTFDEPAERHVKIAGIVLEKAKRLVECGHDVVIMLDSITRLARAFNTVSPASGKILSGGVDANALQRPKRFFGAARNIENGGSLTIIATALTETSSKMDEVIFEEFKGTGNMELQLDRKLSNKRIFPAVDIIASSTRRDDLLLSEETLNRMWILRNYLNDMNSTEAMEFMKKRMEMTRSNEELLVTMDK